MFPHYSFKGIVSPFVVVCNHYANTKPRLQRVESEVLEAHDAINRKVWCLDEGKQYCRRAEAMERKIKENKALKLQIEELKEERKKREA
ncbi:hypothetical protein FNV43_RR15580 [Rhamnella rubrinervis]|uniref:Uncharacterized protein n=1 Tax=Rhamnella rubrinervis TaxID=2594499 RepID=A0A8K0E217_9ROSA|nr:hypothetical protein FNV43_RR15580 [Rhamnella rubrinervis]